MAVEYGQDLLLLDAFGDTFARGSGPALVMAGVYRRWTTDPASVAGQLVYQAQCRDIRHLLGVHYDQARLIGWARELAELAKEDERVDDCAVVFEANPEARVLTLKAAVQPSIGPAFRFVIPFDSFEPSLLEDA